MEKFVITLQQEEREQLEAMLRKGRHASQTLLNALILLNCDEVVNSKGRHSNQEVAAILNVSTRKIERLKRRFVEEGFELVLNGGQRTNYERLVDGDLEARLIALSCNEPPSGRSRWTLQILADKVVELNYVPAISAETVRKTLKKTNSSPSGRLAG